MRTVRSGGVVWGVRLGYCDIFDISCVLVKNFRQQPSIAGFGHGAHLVGSRVRCAVLGGVNVLYHVAYQCVSVF